MKAIKTIPGSFRRKGIYCQFIPSKKETNIFYVFFHGAFSSSLKEKYIHIAKMLTNNSIGNVFLYETSRAIPTFDTKASLLSFEEYRNSFEGKTFEDELADVKSALEFFKNTYLLEVKNPKVCFVGFSLGGTLSSFLIQEYQYYLTNIFLFGSGITTRGHNQPITNTYPDKQAILNNFIPFKGNITLVQGTNDTIVPQEEARQIIYQTKNAFSRSLIFLKDVDHTFTYIGSNKKESILAKKIFQIIETK